MASNVWTGNDRKNGRWPGWYNSMMVVPAIIMTPFWLAQGVAQSAKKSGGKASRKAGTTGFLAPKRKRRTKNRRRPGRRPAPSNAPFNFHKPNKDKPGKAKGKGKGKSSPSSGKTSLDTGFSIEGKARTTGATDGGKAAVEHIKGIADQISKQGVVSR